MSRDRQPPTEENVSPKAPSEPGSIPDSLECDICSFESFEYHSDDGVYRAIFDADVVAPSTAIVGAVSAVANKDPLNIEPLHSTIDPDALDTLFAASRRDESDIHARFSLKGYSIRLSSYGSITVRPSQVESSRTPAPDEE